MAGRRRGGGMRLLVLRGAALPAAAVCAGALIAGCGSSAPAAPPTVQISLTAPTDGATVGVQRVLVFGSVLPIWSTVRIAGVRVHVSPHGRFRRWINIPRGTSRIRVLGTARGYVAEHMRLTIRSAHFQTVAITKPGARWAAQADLACAEINSQVVALPALTPANYLQDFDTIQAAAHRTLARLETIHVPRDHAAAYARFLAGIASVESQSNQIIVYLQHRQLLAAISLARVAVRANDRIDQQASALGLPSCAEDVVPQG